LTAPILIADDDPAIRTLLRLIVERTGLHVDLAADGQEAIALLERKNYALALLDLQMPRANGFDVVEYLRTKFPRPLIIILTALPRSQTLRLDATVVQAIVRKPFDVPFLADIIAGTVRSIGDAPHESSFSGTTFRLES
jgi:two-component system, OmpR family, response regulator